MRCVDGIPLGIGQEDPARIRFICQPEGGGEEKPGTGEHLVCVTLGPCVFLVDLTPDLAILPEMKTAIVGAKMGTDGAR